MTASDMSIAAALSRRTKPEDSFVWQGGGQRLSMDQINQQRRLAAQQMATGADFSPVGHWSAGMARVLQGLSGGMRMRRADRAAEERAASHEIILRELAKDKGVLPDGSDPVAAALADPELRSIGLAAMKARQPKPIEPVIQRANNGDIIGLNPQTGEVMFTRPDPNPKPVLDWITAENPDKTKTLVPVGPNGPITYGGQSPSALPTAPVGKLTPIEPTIENTPAPDLGANGLPTKLSSAQYQATVQAMGKDKTDAWMARNGIRVSN